MKTVKQISFIIICIISFNSSTLLAQSISSFFKYEGVKCLAELAHPTSGFHSGSYNVYDDYIIINANYTNGHNIKMQVNRYGNYFTGIKVIKDSDIVPAFLGVYFAKQLVAELLVDDQTTQSDNLVESFENYLGKRFYDFNGYDLALIGLNVVWSQY